MKDLTELRSEIDTVDTELIELLLKRFEITEQIGEYKAQTGKKLFDPEREKEKLKSLEERLQDCKNSLYVENMFCSLMDCAKYQQSNNTYGEKDIYLIGMPGCGKTTIGRELAKLIQRDFIDLDQQFNVQYGMSAAECIETMGEDEFRNKESMVLKRVSGKVKGWDSRYSVSSRVISCGGGIVVRDTNKELLKNDSVVIYIKRDLEKLTSKGRPLSAKTGIEKLFEQRSGKYENWSNIIINNDTDIDECVASIARALREMNI